MFKVLETSGQLTQKDIIRETLLPSRTVRYALNRLKDEKVLVERHYFIDARQSLYYLKRPVADMVTTGTARSLDRPALSCPVSESVHQHEVH